MTMTPGLRKFALTAHVASSVGFFGAVAGFVALAVAGLNSEDARAARAAYLAMDLTAWFVIVPLALASLLTGLVQALGTEWGLFRHWWVLVKFLISVFATTVLLVYMIYRQTLGYLAGIAAETMSSGAEVEVLRSASPLLHGSVAVVLLLVATTLSVYKPRGMTQYGARKQSGELTTSTPGWVKVLGVIALALLLLVILVMVGAGGHGPSQHMAR